MPPGDLRALQALQEENQRLREAVVFKNELLRQRAEPIFTQVIDAMQSLTMMADMGSPEARQLLVNFHEIFNKSKAVAAGIHVPKNGKRSV